MTVVDTLALLLALVALVSAVLQQTWNLRQDAILERHTRRIQDQEAFQRDLIEMPAPGGAAAVIDLRHVL